MKKTTAILMTGLMTAMLGGCTKPASDASSSAKNGAAMATNSAAPASVTPAENKNAGATSANQSSAPSTASSANTNLNANVSSPASTSAPDPSKLVGTYVMTQILKDGVATMITQAKIEYVFNTNGRYSRVATVKDKTVNTESGQFALDGDKLTFKIVLSGKSINKKPIEKNYTIALTPDGREARLTSKTGDTAVLNRTQ
jgi:hypothetical protein